MNCPICNTSVEASLLYAQCPNCNTIFATKDISSLVTTENDNPTSRNTLEAMQTRLDRVLAQHSAPLMIADIGCGQGEFVSFLKDKSYSVVGVDKDTTTKLQNLCPQIYDTVFAIEVIEHFSNPKELIDTAMDALRPKGILYIETTFADSIPDFSNHSYVSPEIGHRVILSRAALETLVAPYTVSWLNANVVLIHKEQQ